MHRKIVFRHMDHSGPMEQHADQQLKKLEKLLEHEPTPIVIDLILEPSKVHSHHRVELIIKTKHYDRVVHSEGPKFYEVLDHVIDVMYRKLHEDKQRLVDERKTQGQGREEKLKFEQ